MTCTAYSCQVMATTRTYDDADKARLSKSAVVGRALALADAEGLDALTVRRLAQELGVTPMALYWHFRSKEELLTGLATQIWGEIRTDIDAGASWPQQLRSLLESLIQVLRAHPCASQLLVAGEKQNDAALRARSRACQRDRPQHAVDRPDARDERAGLRPGPDRRRARRAAAAQPGQARDAAARPLSAPGRGRCADDVLRRPGVPHPVRGGSVHRRGRGHGAPFSPLGLKPAPVV